MTFQHGEVRGGALDGAPVHYKAFDRPPALVLTITHDLVSEISSPAGLSEDQAVQLLELAAAKYRRRLDALDAKRQGPEP